MANKTWLWLEQSLKWQKSDFQDGRLEATK
jgi:hypothetical protein